VCAADPATQRGANRLADALSNALALAQGEKKCGKDVQVIWFEKEVETFLLQQNADPAAAKLLKEDLRSPQVLALRGLDISHLGGVVSLRTQKPFACQLHEVWEMVWRPFAAFLVLVLAFLQMRDRYVWRSVLWAEVFNHIVEETEMAPRLMGPTALEICETIQEKYPQRAKRVTVQLIDNICSEMVKSDKYDIREDFDDNRAMIRIFWHGKALPQSTPRKQAQSPRLF
jgi:hypothetical protein